MRATPGVLRSIKIGIVILFGILLALPGIQHVTHFGHERTLNGVVKVVVKPDLSCASWLDGTFQSGLTAWLEANIGFRSWMIENDNLLVFLLFREAVSTSPEAPIVGRDGMLFMRDYVNAANRHPRAKLHRPEDLARTLRKLQDVLQARGIAFVFMITPSKVEVYPEYLPPRYFSARRFAEPGDYDRLIPCLDQAGLRYVDGRKILTEERKRSNHLLFAPTGVHWNHYATSLVLRETIRIAEQLAGCDLPGLTIRGATVDFKPRKAEAETDIADLLNLASHVVNRKPLPRPLLENEPWTGVRKPRYLLVGDSFLFQVHMVLEALNLYDTLDMFYYFSKWYQHPGGQEKPIDKDNVDWEGQVFSHDVIILECNEVQLFMADHGFVLRALHALGVDEDTSPP
jgi:hypothetical protein